MDGGTHDTEPSPITATVPVANLRLKTKMALTTCPLVQMGDALLGQLARALVLLVALAAPTTMAKDICWDYSDEDMGPLVPEWSSEPRNNFFNWSARQAEFA